MKFLVGAHVLSEATKPQRDANVVAWLAAHETQLAINPIILGELRFGILALPKSKRRSGSGVRYMACWIWIPKPQNIGRSCWLI